MNNEAKEKKISHGLKLAMIRAGAALLAAVILLVGTGLSAFTLIRGAQEPESLLEVEDGAFVKRDVFAILGFYGEEVSGKDKVTARYAVVPVDGKLATVLFSGRYLESAMAVQNNTYDFVNGKVETLDKYVKVQGTVAQLSEEQSGLMYDWFGINKDQLVSMNFISDTDDYADYLTDTVILVDTVNYRSQNLVIALNIIAALCLVYFAAELVLMAAGFYHPGRKKSKGCDCDCKESDGDCSAEGCEDDHANEDEKSEKTSVDEEKPEDKE